MSVISSISVRIEARLRHRGVQVGVVLGLVLMLELIVFRGYFVGETIPPWDFLGSYNTDAYFWWSEGSFFDPVEWVPTVWGGYPSSLNLQNSAWYLPVGIAALFGPFTLHASAIVSALHVGLGAMGTYFLVRRYASFGASVIAAMAGFFAVGYFSNAQHVDIVRGYALIPIVLLVLTVQFPWRRWWGVPLGAFVLWQTATGMYPGMLLASVYVVFVWLVVQQLLSRAPIKQFLLPVILSGVIALLLSMPRLLPYALASSDAGSAEGLPEQSVTSVSLLGTLLFGYGSSDLPGDISMRSLFVPGAVLLLACFARWRAPLAKMALSLGVPAVLLGLPFLPWFSAAQSLPGLGLSRFTMNDFKPYMILALILLAASGFDAIRQGGRDYARRMVVGVGLAGVLIVGLAVVSRDPVFAAVPRTTPLVVLVLTALLVVALRATRASRWTHVVAGGLVILTGFSGASWAFTTQQPWTASRVNLEIETYGTTVDTLLADRHDTDTARRPSRVPLAPGFDLYALYDTGLNRVFYSGETAVGGYLNLKGSRTQSQLSDALLGSAGEGFAAFLAAPGSILVLNGSGPTTNQQIAACGTEGTCGQGAWEPVNYIADQFSYRIDLREDARVLLNEPYYEGWSATACSDDGCDAVDLSRDSRGLIGAALPAGSYVLELTYNTAGRSLSWVLFAVGLLLGATYPLFTAVQYHRQKGHAR